MFILLKNLKNNLYKKRLYILVFTVLVGAIVTVFMNYPSPLVVMLVFGLILLNATNYRNQQHYFFVISFGLLVAIVVARMFRIEFIANNLGIWLFLFLLVGLVVLFKQLREN